MKKKLLRLASVLGLSLMALFLSSCHDHGIVILPVEGAHHARVEASWDRIQKILDTHPDLYYVETYKDGTLDPKHPPSGKLCELLLVLKLDEIHSAAAKNKYTGHTVQVGGAINASFDLEAFNPTATSPNARAMIVPKMPQAHYPQFVTESSDLVKSIKETLKDSGEPSGGQGR